MKAPLALLGTRPAPVALARIVSAAMGAGASGYVGKLLPRARMVDAFARIWDGEAVVPEGCEIEGPEAGEAAALARGFASLTPQQMNILRLICQGRPNKIIAPSPMNLSMTPPFATAARRTLRRNEPMKTERRFGSISSAIAVEFRRSTNRMATICRLPSRQLPDCSVSISGAISAGRKRERFAREVVS